jgi:peptide deformylase
MLQRLFVILILIISTSGYAMQIVTIEHDPTNCLATTAAAVPITKEGLEDAAQIVSQMQAALRPLTPAAGLAAPQIGISKQIFIFSWDRTMHHLDIAINPSFKPIGDEIIEGWEACFSAALTNGKSEAAFLKRYKKISATYTDLDGKIHQKILEDFAAKVFQHEYDHLQGIVNVKRIDAKVKSFDSKIQMIEFMTNVKKKDSISYTTPVDN